MVLPVKPSVEIEEVVHLPNVSPRVTAVSKIGPRGKLCGDDSADQPINPPFLWNLDGRARCTPDL